METPPSEDNAPDAQPELTFISRELPWKLLRNLARLRDSGRFRSSVKHLNRIYHVINAPLPGDTKEYMPDDSVGTDREDQ